jgi:CRISPR-associated protein Cas6
MQTVYLSFPIVGDTIPLDHGYALYSAISRLVPDLHRLRDVGIHPVRGLSAGQGKLRVTARSRLALRTSAAGIPRFLLLSGKTLDLDGHRVRIGVPQVLALRPTPGLAARMVTIRGFMEPAAFLEAAKRQLVALDISNEAMVEIPVRAQTNQFIRRTLRIKDKTIVGFAVRVCGLPVEESLRLQEAGLGGRRHMGCGVFVPAGRT